MFEIGDYLVYRKDVCQVKDIKKGHFENINSYILAPVNDDSMKIEVPTDHKHIRPLMSKEEVENLINRIPEIPVIEETDKTIENEYRKLLNSEKIEDLIRIIKATFSRNQERILKNRKISEKDETYFNQAEKYVYTEFAIALNLSYDEAKEYVISKVESLQS